MNNDLVDLNNVNKNNENIIYKLNDKINSLEDEKEVLNNEIDKLNVLLNIYYRR